MIQASLFFTEGVPLTLPSRHEYAPWLALTRVKGQGAVGCKKLLTQFADPVKIFSASPAELKNIEGMQSDAVEGLTSFPTGRASKKRCGASMRRASA
jgi:predicted Rossmann fold nucleotide-binding protein DprA/Smf involved in DNA uptake